MRRVEGGTDYRFPRAWEWVEGRRKARQRASYGRRAVRDEHDRRDIAPAVGASLALAIILFLALILA
jgi:hypothetical protein